MFSKALSAATQKGITLLMRILQHSASFSYSLPPDVPLLTAPIPPLQLPAPTIAGLLPMSLPRRVEVFFDQPRTANDMFRLLGPIRTLDEMDAEIAVMIDQRLTARRAIREMVS
jgi:hypothetical protein